MRMIRMKYDSHMDCTQICCKQLNSQYSQNSELTSDVLVLTYLMINVNFVIKL